MEISNNLRCSSKVWPLFGMFYAMCKLGRWAASNRVSQKFTGPKSETVFPKP